MARADGEAALALAAASWQAEDGAALVREADAHGLAALLERALGAHGERVLGRSAALALHSLCALQRRTSRAQQEALSEIVGAAERRGVAICWLKGAAVAATVYEEPSLRPMGDLDLLVAPAQERAAIDLLTGLGFASAGGWQRRRGSHQLPPAGRVVGGVRVVVEIHVDALSYLAPGSLVLGRSARIEALPPPHAGGRPVATLGATDTLAQLVAHAVNVRQRFTLVHLADLARWIGRFDDRIDWGRLRRDRGPALRRLAWLSQLVPMPGHERLAASRACADLGVAYRGWSRQGLRRARRSVSFAELVRHTLAPPEWWACAQYGAAPATPAWWLRGVRHPAHLLRVAAHRMVEQ